MGQNMMVLLKMERNGDKEPISGLMRAFTSATGLTITSKVKVSIDGQMVEFIKVNGKKISYMVEESTHGQMEENMKAIMRMTKSTVSAHTHGPTENLMRANGLTANSTVRPVLPILKEGVRWVFGRTESVSNGSTQSPPFYRNHQMQLVAHLTLENYNKTFSENQVKASLQNNELNT